MIIDFKDSKMEDQIVGTCPHCGSVKIKRISCATDRGQQDLGIECEYCGVDLIEDEIIWVEYEEGMI